MALNASFENDEDTPTANGHSVNGATAMPLGRPLFGRLHVGKHAVASPFSRRRDVHGDTTPRVPVYDQPISNAANLRTSYSKAIQSIAIERPLQAARLDDMIDRIEVAEIRYREVIEQEQQAHQNYNEEAAISFEQTEPRLEELRKTREKVDADQTFEIEERRSNLLQCREKLAVMHVVNDLPLTLRDWGADDEQEALQRSPLLGRVAGESQQASGGAAAEPGDASEAVARLPGGVFGQLAGQLRQRLKRPDVSGAAVPVLSDAMQAHVLPGPPLEDVGQDEDVSPLPPVIYSKFPIAEGLEQAPSANVLAHKKGLPSVSPAAETFEQREAYSFGWIALVACGSIFGISVGLLLQVLDPRALALNASNQIGSFAVCAFFGVSLFWILGKTVSGVAALASEERCHAHMAKYLDDRDKIGDWLLATARGSLIAILIVAAVLIVIEATVERYGIVQTVIDKMKNALMLGGHTSVVSAGGPPAAVGICLALVASVPFVFYHLAEGWIKARARCMKAAVSAEHENIAWEIATRLHVDRQKKAQEAALEDWKERLQRARQSREALAAANLSVSEAEHDAILSSAPPGIVSMPGDRLDDSEAMAAAPVPDSDEKAGDARLSSLLRRRVQLAIANERARNAYARLREAYARRRDALKWYDDRIAEVIAIRRTERAEPPINARRRVEDAFNDLSGAVKEFDAAYALEVAAVEKLRRPGLFVRLWRWLFKR